MNSQSFFLTHAQDTLSHQKTVDCWKKSRKFFELIWDNNARFFFGKRLQCLPWSDFWRKDLWKVYSRWNEYHFISKNLPVILWHMPKVSFQKIFYTPSYEKKAGAALVRTPTGSYQYYYHYCCYYYHRHHHHHHRGVWKFSLQNAANVATIVAVTKLISRKVNDMKTMSSEELNKTLAVLKNLTAKIQHFNTTGGQAKDLITVGLEIGSYSNVCSRPMSP